MNARRNMAVPKQEEADEVEIIEPPKPSGLQSPTKQSSRSNTCQLTVEQAATLPYPVGSIVWYRSECGQRMTCGAVKSVSIDLLSREFQYNIVETTFGQVHGAVADSHSEMISVVEGNVVCFGAGCPVKVKMGSGKELVGSVVHGKATEESTTYSIVLHMNEKKTSFVIEDGVAADRIKYRATTVAPSVNTTSSFSKEPESPSVPSVLELHRKVSSEEGSSWGGSSNKRSNDGTNSEDSASKKAKKLSETMISMDIPSWLLKDRSSRKELFDYLKRDSTLGSPIQITGTGREMQIFASAKTCNINILRSLVQSSLLQFLNGDCSEYRLLYDLAVAAGVDTILPLGNKKVVQSSDIIKRHRVWATVLELPFVKTRNGTTEYHSQFLACKLDWIRAGTSCTVSIYGEPRKCNPFILV